MCDEYAIFFKKDITLLMVTATVVCTENIKATFSSDTEDSSNS